MADDDTPENDLDPNERDWKHWKEAKATAAELEISQKLLLQYVRQNRISRWRAPDGTWRYKPDEIESLRDKLMSAEESVLPAKSGLEDVLAAAVALLNQAHSHIETLTKNMTSPMKQGIDFLIAAHAQTLERLKNIEDKHEELYATRERLLSEEELRQLLRRSQEQTEARKQEAWKLLMKQAPMIFDQFKRTLESRSPEARAAVDLLQSIDPAMVAALLEMDLLTPAQKELLKQVLAKKQSEKSQGTSESSAPKTEPAGTAPPPAGDAAPTS